MTQPTEAATATASTITDDQLDALRAERDSLGREADRMRRDWTDLRARAERVEQQLAQVRAYADKLCAEPHPTHDHVCPDEVRTGLLAALDSGEQPSPAAEHRPVNVRACSEADLPPECSCGANVWCDRPAPAADPQHAARGTNAEDCPACSGTNPPYPWLCPGPPAEEPRCVCGDPIVRMDHPDDPGWIHTPGSNTRCLTARERPAESPRHDSHAGATRTTSPTSEGESVQNHAGAADGHLAILAWGSAYDRANRAEAAVSAAYTLANQWTASSLLKAADELRETLDRARTQEQPARPAANVPGSTTEQLPAEVLAPLDLIPYLSTACQTAGAIWDAAERIPDAGKRAGALHTRCRLNHKFTGQQCTCDCHTTEETP